jgi:hypothetical protein
MVQFNTKRKRQRNNPHSPTQSPTQALYVQINQQQQGTGTIIGTIICMSIPIDEKFQSKCNKPFSMHLTVTFHGVGDCHSPRRIADLWM